MEPNGPKQLWRMEEEEEACLLMGLTLVYILQSKIVVIHSNKKISGDVSLRGHTMHQNNTIRS